MPGNSNTFNGVFVAGWFNIARETTWQADLPYIIEYTLTISQGKTLTIEPGVVIKFYSGYSEIIVSGTLKAIGGETDDEKIVFTSYSSNPQAGDWKQIYFSPTSVDSKLINVIVNYEGSDPSYDPLCPGQMGAIRVDQSSITLKNSIIEQNQRKGLYLINSSSTIDNVQFLNHQIGCTGLSGTYYDAIALWIEGSEKFPQLGANIIFQDNSKDIFIEYTEKFCSSLPDYLKSYKTNCPNE